eukprot:8800581-Alexandrium_andersonii.AAC.1
MLRRAPRPPGCGRRERSVGATPSWSNSRRNGSDGLRRLPSRRHQAVPGRARRRVEALAGSETRAQLAQAQAIQGRQEALR